MKHYAMVIFTSWLMIISVVNDVLADESTKTLGSGASIFKVDGPASVQVRMGDCNFSISLKDGEHVKYNDPDLVFYRAFDSVSDYDLPYLKQAEMYAGYDWWFERNSAAHIPWIGFMCENTSDFKWSSNPEIADITQALQDVMDSNSLRCPADFDGKKWVPMSKEFDDHFATLDVDGAQGFVVDEPFEHHNRSVGGSRFCFVSGDSVLIGISGDGLMLPTKGDVSSNSILEILKAFKFPSIGRGK
ncbi:hypothetical protein [Burkholderia ubonensis]|uniref:hypothetical protein n=1 Tax=Burkholderia ubonensis TaxID=101571 RepID=UPI000ADAA060|nr:hypothetical protein [Burkholderia ubonensis]